MKQIETIILSEFIHLMAIRRTVRSNELEDKYAEMLRQLTRSQREQLFFVVRKVKRRTKPVYRTIKPIITKWDVKIILRYYEAGGTLTDIHKLFFTSKYSTFDKFYYNLHKDASLSRQLKIIDIQLKKSYK